MTELNKDMINLALKDLVPNIKQQGSTEPLGIIAWVQELKSNDSIIIGLALRQGVGCSPFCGCAADQLGRLLEIKLKQRFPQINRVRAIATYPPPEIEQFWNL